MKKKTVWEMGRPSLGEFRSSAKAPLVVVMDNIRSLNNIGSVFRTCDAFGVRLLCLCGITATPPSVEIHKTALGAEESVDWQYFPTTMEAVDYLKGLGYTLIALEQAQGSVSPTRLPGMLGPDGKYALVCGNEIDGVAQDVVDAADICLEIPQIGTKHSLNVSVSTGIGLWTLFQILHPGI